MSLLNKMFGSKPKKQVQSGPTAAEAIQRSDLLICLGLFFFMNIFFILDKHKNFIISFKYIM
jgi:hypothetical protein